MDFILNCRYVFIKYADRYAQCVKTLQLFFIAK